MQQPAVLWELPRLRPVTVHVSTVHVPNPRSTHANWTANKKTIRVLESGRNGCDTSDDYDTFRVPARLDTRGPESPTSRRDSGHIRSGAGGGLKMEQLKGVKGEPRRQEASPPPSISAQPRRAHKTARGAQLRAALTQPRSAITTHASEASRDLCSLGLRALCWLAGREQGTSTLQPVGSDSAASAASSRLRRTL